MHDAVENRLGLRTGSVLWAAAFAASAAIGTHGVAYWDAGDYVRHAIEGSPSGLLLGRPLFLAVSRGILALGVDPHWAEPILRWFWSAVSAFGAPAMAALALAIGLPRRAALVCGFALALSPAFAHTSHHVLTDAPALVLSITALLAAARGRAALAGVIIAAAITTRETAAVHLIAIVFLLGVKRGLAATSVAAASLAIVLWAFPPPGLAQWFDLMSGTTESHPLDVAHVALAAAWVFAAGPLPVLVGLTLTPEAIRRTDRVRLVALPALVGTAALLFYPDGSFSPRYMLATAPVALFFTAAPWLAARPRLTAAALLGPLLLMPLLVRRNYAIASRGKDVMARTAALPAGAFVVPGHYCPHVQLAAAIDSRRDLALMCPGWGWPKDPAATLDSALASGRDVAVDLADNAWLGGREKPARAAVHEWANGRQGRVVEGWTIFRINR